MWIFSSIIKCFNNPNKSNPLDIDISIVNCLSKNNDIKKILTENKKATYLEVFTYPEEKFNAGNFGYFILETIKKDDVIIIGSKNLGCEYSEWISFTSSIYRIKQHKNIALNVVGKPSKYIEFSFSLILNRANLITPKISGAEAIISPEIPGIFWEYNT